MSVRTALHALRSRNFAILWLGNLLSNTGSWMQQVAEPWLVLKLSGSAFLLGVDSFAGDAPMWLFILAGGLLADRRDRRRTALLFQGLQAACPTLLVILLLTGVAKVWMVIVLSVIVGLTDALSMPSVQAIVPSSVPPEDVPSAVALNSTQFNLSRVLGPMVAGLVMASLGITACFALNAATYVPFLFALFLLRMPRPVPTSPDEPPVSLLASVRMVASKRELRRAMLTVLVSSLLCAPVVTFIPVIIREFQLGGGEFGGALALFGTGGLLGSASVLLLMDNRQRQIVSSLAALSLSALVMGLGFHLFFRNFLAMVFLIGVAMSASNTAAQTIVQSSIDPAARGRVSSLYSLAVRGGAPLGNVVTGLVISRWNVYDALMANGILAIILHLSLMLLIRAHVRRDGLAHQIKSS